MFCTRNKNVRAQGTRIKDGGAGERRRVRDGLVTMPESFILFFWLIFPFFLVETASAMYEGCVTADVAAVLSRNHPVADSPVI